MKGNKFVHVCAVIGGLLLVLPASAETCCEKAAAAGKECQDKCCVAAHKHGKSCVKCNPNKEDLKLKKAEHKSDKNAKTKKPA